MVKREEDLTKLEEQRRKQADEFSVTFIQLESEGEKKLKELKDRQVQLAKSMIGKYLPGEEDARQGRAIRKYELTLDSQSAARWGPIGEYHFRYAESQFRRLCGGLYNVHRVDYVLNPDLVKRFEGRQKEYHARGFDGVMLGFHGTNSTAVETIIKVRDCLW